MKIFIFIFSSFILFNINSFAQSYTVNWGELDKGVKGQADDIIPHGGSDFYTLRISGKTFLTYSLTRHENYKLVESGKIQTKVNGRSANFEEVQLIDGRIFVFLSDAENGENNLYVQEYSKDIEPKGEAIKLVNYKIENKWSKGSFRVTTSNDKSFFAIEWVIYGTKKEVGSFGYKVFDKNLQEVSKGEYDLPANSKLISLNEHYLSNTGDYFIAINEFNPSEKKNVFQNYSEYKAFHLYHITPKGAEQHTIETDGKRIVTLTMNSNNDGIFRLIGGYSEKDQPGMGGIFNLSFDMTKGVVVSENYERFKTTLFNENREEKNLEFYNFQMRNTEVLKDGRVIGSMERIYQSTVTRTDSQGITRTTTYYHYDGIITFCIGKEGEFEWMKFIQKKQQTTDGGVPSSYSRFVDGDKVVFIFNDNILNYNENGKFELVDGKLEIANYRKKKNTVAIVSIDVNSGEMKRETFFDRNEVESFAIPKKFNVDYVNNEVLLYCIKGSKERFGLIKLTGNN